MAEKQNIAETRWFVGSKISAEQVVHDHEAFMREKLSRTGDVGKQELLRIATIRKGNKGTTSKTAKDNGVDLTEMLKNMSLETLSQYVQGECANLRNAKAGLDSKRTKGMHRVNNKTERFFVEFDRFLTAYSGIVKILASIDAQYGGVATATLALLFTAARMKSQDEQAIVSAMGHISDRLPDFSIYQKIYPDPALEEMLSDAYRDVILLSREATSYFQCSTFRRHMRSMGKPAGFEIMEQSMRENFSRVRLKCEAMLAAKVDDLEQKLENIQEHRDRDLVTRLRDALDLGDYKYEEAKEELSIYRKVLESKFDRDRHRQKLALAEFLAGETSRPWTDNGSVVLILHGTNEPGIGTVSQSWLSPVAVDLTQELLKNECIVAFDICSERSTCKGVLARLIHQLLEVNPRVVRKADHWKDLEKYIVERKMDRQEGLEAALSRIIDLQNKPVFIILDRPEWNEAEDPSEYIRTMLSLAKEAKKDLKVLMIMRTEFWKMDEENRRNLSRGCPELLQSIRLDQRRIK